MEGLSSPSTSLGYLFCLVPIVLEMSGLDIPFINFVRDSVKGHDPFHEWCGNPSSKETNKDVVVHDASMGDIALEG